MWEIKLIKDGADVFVPQDLEHTVSSIIWSVRDLTYLIEWLKWFISIKLIYIELFVLAGPTTSRNIY